MPGTQLLLGQSDTSQTNENLKKTQNKAKRKIQPTGVPTVGREKAVCSYKMK